MKNHTLPFVIHTVHTHIHTHTHTRTHTHHSTLCLCSRVDFYAVHIESRQLCGFNSGHMCATTIGVHLTAFCLHSLHFVYISAGYFLCTPPTRGASVLTPANYIPCYFRLSTIHRVFSLHPIEGYEPPVLSGHKDAIVAVFFMGAATRHAALVGFCGRSRHIFGRGCGCGCECGSEMLWCRLTKL